MYEHYIHIPETGNSAESHRFSPGMKDLEPGIGYVVTPLVYEGFLGDRTGIINAIGPYIVVVGNRDMKLCRRKCTSISDVWALP